MSSDIFAISVSPLELIIRGTCIYWFVFLAYRFFLRRGTGQIGFADIMLLVLIADASGNALSGTYDSVAEGIILIATLMLWSWTIDIASLRYRWIDRLITAPPVLLIHDGQIIHRNLRKEHLTRDDLNEQLRLNGIACVTDVKRAYFEGDGEISIIRYS